MSGEQDLRADEAPIEDAEEVHGSPHEPVRSELEEGLESLGRVAGGLATRLFGPAVRGQAARPEQPTVSPDVDQAVEDVGRVVGHWLRAAGESMKHHPQALDEAVSETIERVQEPAPDVEDERGWSPLVQGARAFSEGLGELAGGLLDRLAPPRPTGGEE